MTKLGVAASFGAIAGVLFLGLHILKPAPEAAYREYRPGTKVARNEEVVTVTATMDAKAPRTSSQLVRATITIGGTTDVKDKVLETSPWVRAYVVKKGTHVLATITQGTFAGSFGCILLINEQQWDEDARWGNTTAICERK